MRPGVAAVLFAGVSLTAVAALTSCEHPGSPAGTPYDPVVAFSAFVNGDSVYLPGSLNYPNRCVLAGDTVKMDFYSQDYCVNPPPGLSGGMHLKLHVYPRAADSNTTTFSTRRLMVHCTMHQPVSTCTFEILPADSQSLSNSASMVADRYEVRRDGAIAFSEVVMAAGAIGQAQCGTNLTVTKGWIRGRVE